MTTAGAVAGAGAPAHLDPVSRAARHEPEGDGVLEDTGL